jgi:hypothetical protein
MFIIITATVKTTHTHTKKMGNTKTKLQIDQYFEKKIVPKKINFSIKINLTTPAKNRDDEVRNYVIVECNKNTKDDLVIWNGTEGILEGVKATQKWTYTHEWTPRSHMRDFEVIDSFTPKELRIARGQGIGVIIVEQLEMYLKLYYTKDSEFGVKAASYSLWYHGERSKEILSEDLALGYNVFLIDCEGDVHDLCEEKDERDKEDIIIYAPGLDPSLAKYNNNEEDIIDE